MKTRKSCYLCPLCDTDCKYLGQLAMHLNWVHKNKGTQPLICKVCGKRLSQPIHYVHHLQSHVVEELTCAVCGKIFAREANLKRHQLSHRKQNKCSEGQMQSDPSPVVEQVHTTSPIPQSTQVQRQPSSNTTPSVSPVTSVQSQIAISQATANPQYVFIQQPNGSIRMQPVPISAFQPGAVQLQPRMALVNTNMGPQYVLVRPPQQFLSRPAYIQGYNIPTQVRMSMPTLQPLPSASPVLAPPGTSDLQMLPECQTNPNPQSAIQAATQQTNPPVNSPALLNLPPGSNPPALSNLPAGSNPPVSTVQGAVIDCATNASPRSMIQQPTQQTTSVTSASAVIPTSNAQQAMPVFQTNPDIHKSPRASPLAPVIIQPVGETNSSKEFPIQHQPTEEAQSLPKSSPIALSTDDVNQTNSNQQFIYELPLSPTEPLSNEPPTSQSSVQDQEMSSTETNHSIQPTLQFMTQQNPPSQNTSSSLNPPGTNDQQSPPVSQSNSNLQPKIQQVHQQPQPLIGGSSRILQLQPGIARSAAQQVLPTNPSLQSSIHQPIQLIQAVTNASPVLPSSGMQIQPMQPVSQVNSSLHLANQPSSAMQIQPTIPASQVNSSLLLSNHQTNQQTQPTQQLPVVQEALPATQTNPVPQVVEQQAQQPQPSVPPITTPTTAQQTIPEIQTNASLQSTFQQVPQHIVPLQLPNPCPVVLTSVHHALPAIQTIPNPQSANHQPSQSYPQTLPTVAPVVLSTNVKQVIPVSQSSSNQQSSVQQSTQQTPTGVSTNILPPATTLQAMPACQTYVMSAHSSVQQSPQQPHPSSVASPVSVASGSITQQRMSPSITQPRMSPSITITNSSSTPTVSRIQTNRTQQATSFMTNSSSTPTVSRIQTNRTQQATSFMTNSNNTPTVSRLPTNRTQQQATSLQYTLAQSSSVARSMSVYSYQAQQSQKQAQQQAQQARVLSNLQGYNVLAQQQALLNSNANLQSVRPSNQQPTTNASIMYPGGSRINVQQMMASGQPVAQMMASGQPVAQARAMPVAIPQAGGLLAQPSTLQPRLLGSSNTPRMVIPTSTFRPQQPQSANLQHMSLLQGYNIQLQQRMALPKTNIHPQYALLRAAQQPQSSQVRQVFHAARYPSQPFLRPPY